MAIVYRYIDLHDNLTKYIGIITSNNKKRCIEDRLKEHRVKDAWANGHYSIEYFIVGSRTDAEAFESHLIALFKTYKFYNKAKSDWGISNYLPYNIKWKKYVTYDGVFIQDKSRRNSEYHIDNINYDKKYSLWKGKNGLWYSYIPDANKKYGRRLIKRNSKENLVRYLNDFYSTNILVD